MDDLARAAGLSRQGLYLHFSTKEELFQAAVARAIAVVEDACRAALSRTELPAIDRLLGAFETFHGRRIGQPGQQDVGEILEADTSLVGGLCLQHEQRFVTAVAGLLTESGASRTMSRVGVGPREVAETLLAVSFGLKRRVTTAVEYRDRMAVALRIALADVHAGEVVTRRWASNFPT